MHDQTTCLTPAQNMDILCIFKSKLLDYVLGKIPLAHSCVYMKYAWVYIHMILPRSCEETTL